MVQKNQVRWIRIGKQIRVHRQRAGLSQEDLAARVLLSPTMLSAIERGARGIKRDHVERIDAALGTGGAITDEWDRTSGTGLPSWYRGVADIERAALEIREYHPVLVPGLFQTSAYARTVVRYGRPGDPDVEVDRIVQTRLDRQEVLDQPHPPFVLAVLDEMVVRRPVGGREIMGHQLNHLLEMSAKPNITIQIIPFTTEHHPGLSGAFRLLQGSSGNDVVYLENVLSTTPLDESEQVRYCVRLYGELRGAALPPAESRELMESIRGELQ